jgi:hypothetical protein
MPGFSNSERLSVYTHLRTFESDFDKSQGQIRAICSAWSAAALGAIGLIAVNAFTPPVGPIDPARGEHLAYLRGVICMIGSAGVFAFWFIDQRVYQKLLHSIFAYGLFLELKHPDLPQLRSSLFIANLDITSGLSWFYRMQFWIFLLIAAVFVLQPFAIDLGPVPKGIKSLTWLHLGLVVFGEWRSSRWLSLQKIIEELYPDLRNALPERGHGLARRIWAWFLFCLRNGVFGNWPPENAPLRDGWKERVKSMPMPPPIEPLDEATPAA